MTFDQPEKMDLRSLDISADNRAKLKQLFPTVFTETVDENGRLVESIDFEKLKAELGTFSDLFESRRERYGMDWPGKKDCLKIIQQPSLGTLKPCREESVNFDTTENLFIEGDNLEVLKLLQKSYYGKIKMIYIDPPYNTGNEFIYPDKYSETLETYLAYAGLTDGEGKKFATNTPNEGRFHTKWMNMMYPRLYLARNLLREDGIILISIDDHEVTNLRKICDEVFGEENFVANIVWQKKYGPANDAKLISDTHEYLMCFCKSIEKWTPYLLPRNEKQLKAFQNPDNDPRGVWRASDLSARTYSKNCDYPIKTPSGRVVYPPPSRSWIITKERFDELVNDNRIWFGVNGDGRPMQKKFLSEIKEGITPQTWWGREFAGDNKIARYELKDIFPENVYDTPKPTSLIKRAIEISCKSGIVLDFFSGSCTAAHAVLELNKEDGMNRKFIMIQLPEPCDEESEACKAGYKTIADIGKERIRRVIKKIEEEQAAKANDPQMQLPGLEEERPQLDLGFKVFKLDRSNFRVWDGTDPEMPIEKLVEQLTLHADHINAEASQEDILYELLLKAGYPLTSIVEKMEMAGKTVYSIAEGALLICLEDEITRELIDAAAEAEPVQFICLDRGFKGNDQLKANAVQTFAARNQGRDKEKQIVFRTV